jgi:hypothetical protein
MLVQRSGTFALEAFRQGMAGLGRVENAVIAIATAEAFGNWLAVIRKNGVISGGHALRGRITSPRLGGIRGHGDCSRAAG